MTRWLALFLAPALALAVHTAGADGGTPIASGLVAGPYDLTVYSDSNPINTAKADISVLVLKRGTTDIVDGATVTITAESPGRPTVTGTATRDLATNKLFYATNLSLPNAGRWKLTVTVVGPDGTGSASFDANAERANNLFDYAFWLAVIVVIPALIVFWILRRRRSSRAAAASKG